MCGFIRAHCCDIMWIVVSEHTFGVAIVTHVARYHNLYLDRVPPGRGRNFCERCSSGTQSLVGSWRNK